MHKAVESTRREFSTLRSGKASTSLLDLVRVEAYGSAVPLNQVAMVAAPEPRLLTVQPFDKSLGGRSRCATPAPTRSRGSRSWST
jgi:ribosome recycling factor